MYHLIKMIKELFIPAPEILPISVLLTSSTCNFSAAIALFVASKE